jgi:hypothetical protein
MDLIIYILTTKSISALNMENSKKCLGHGLTKTDNNKTQ